MNRTTAPIADQLVTPWGSRSLPLPWREPVSFASLAGSGPELPGQRPASTDEQAPALPTG